MRPLSRLCLGLCLAVAGVAPSKATEFWLADVDPVHKTGPADYMGLFDPGAPWQRAASHLSVFKIAAETVTMGSDDMLRSIFNTMHQKHVAMAMEMGAVLQQPSDMCGGGEGFIKPAMLQRIGIRLHALGLTLQYMAMDGPVWVGHERSWRVIRGQADCQYPVAEVARRAAQTVSVMQQNFPGIRVGEIEAVTSRLDPDVVLRDYAQFEQMMRQMTGQPLVFFHCDTAWQLPDWQRIIVALRRQTHAAGMRFGIIFGGSAEDQTDEAWVADGLRRLSLLSAPSTRPDDVIIQSWQHLPDRMLPETDAGSATYMLLQAERLLP